MNILLWIIFGGLAGWLASVIVGGDAGMGIVANVVVGIVGAFFGGWIADQLGAGGTEGAERPTNLMSFFWAVLGGVALLLILNLLF